MVASECRQKSPVQQWRKLQKSISNVLSHRMGWFLPEAMTRNLCTGLFLTHLHSTDFILSACGKNKSFKEGFPTGFCRTVQIE